MSNSTAKLLELQMIAGPAATRQIVVLFADELNRVPARIEMLLGHAEWSKAAKLAHSLAGAAASLGYSELATVSRALEAVLLEGVSDPVDLSEFLEAAQKARANLECIAATVIT